jgi:hypothetical protein
MKLISNIRARALVLTRFSLQTEAAVPALHRAIQLFWTRHDTPNVTEEMGTILAVGAAACAGFSRR